MILLIVLAATAAASTVYLVHQFHARSLTITEPPLDAAASARELDHAGDARKAA